ncbi:glycosyltransferase family 4 protein [Chloroflexota bacterium]
MILLVTIGSGSLDVYSQKLCESNDVPAIWSDIYQRCLKCRNLSWWSPETARIMWHDWCFVRKLNSLGDIIHFPSQHFGRYSRLLKVPFIITVHDLIRYFDLSQDMVFIHPPNSRDSFYLNLDYKGLSKADRIIAISQSTRTDLMYYLNIPEEQIRVIYQGVNHKLFHPAPDRLYDFPYVLFVSSEHPRKNLPGVLQAFSLLKKDPAFRDLKLVKVGESGGTEADYREKTEGAIEKLGLTREVIITGIVPEKDLPVYYSGAAAFVLPSFYEGFGLTPLEAMACGCPVITSNTSSLPEVVGDVGIMVAPDDTAGLAAAMKRVLTDNELRNGMIGKGLARAEEFSWEKTARQTQEVYNEVADERRYRNKEERREKRLKKKRERVPKHGRGLARMYMDAIMKRLKRHTVDK